MSGFLGIAVGMVLLAACLGVRFYLDERRWEREQAQRMELAKAQFDADWKLWATTLKRVREMKTAPPD